MSLNQSNEDFGYTSDKKKEGGGGGEKEKGKEKIWDKTCVDILYQHSRPTISMLEWAWPSEFHSSPTKNHHISQATLSSHSNTSYLFSPLPLYPSNGCPLPSVQEAFPYSFLSFLSCPWLPWKNSAFPQTLLFRLQNSPVRQTKQPLLFPHCTSEIQGHTV